jgi:quinoprotein glucose dehydrogenase
MAYFVRALILASLCPLLGAQSITARNVGTLERAWEFHHGEPLPEQAGRRPSFAATPVFAEGKLFVITPRGTAIAIDPANGKEIWRVSRTGETRRSWGASYANGRLFYGTPDGKLVCLLARNGERLWEADLRAGFGEGHLSQNMPPAVVDGLVITGGEAPEGVPQGPPGQIRAWRQSDGKLAWTFHLLPQDEDEAARTWAAGSRVNRTGVNVWGQCAVDAAAHALYCPTGSASYDFYGGDRHGDNLYANSVVALDARTGQVRWHRQLVHHDIWDYDLPAKPVLFVSQGKPALAQVTKMGFVWILDRRTGEPLFGSEERAVPPSRVPGERTSATQPFPLKPPPLARTLVREDELNTLTPQWAAECGELYRSTDSQGLFAPWSHEAFTLMMPGTLGGGTWSGAGHDAARKLLFVNVNELGIVGKLVQRNGRWVRISPTTHNRFATKDYVPCTMPPWNTLNAIDTETGDVRWRVPLGELPAAKALGFANTGAYGLGGALAMPGGVVFIGGTADATFRAFDAVTGELLWKHALSASAFATPMRFVDAEGNEVVLVAAGGGSFFPGPASDALVAFRLPRRAGTARAGK